MDTLARGWSPSSSTRRVVFLLVGVALVTFPLWGASLGVGQPEYVYETSRVTFDSGDATYESDALLRDPTSGLDCFFGPRFDRGCVGAQGVVTEDVNASLHPAFVYDDPYVANPNTGQVYRRTANRTASGGVYGLVAVRDETAIRDVARDWENVEPWVKRAIRADETRVTVDRPIDDDRYDNYRTLFVERDGEMWVVSEQGPRESFVDQEETTVNVLAVLVGLLVFRRGVRLRSE